MSISVIRARLDLLVSLLDTTTGRPVNTLDVRIYRNGELTRPASRGGGNYIFINTDREDFLMRVEVRGYESCDVPIKYAELDERVPQCLLFLMPSESKKSGIPVMDYSGNDPRIKAIEAINIDTTNISFASFTKRDNSMDFFSQARTSLTFDNQYYAILKPDRKGYVKVRIKEVLSTQKVRLYDAPPPEELGKNAPIARIIFGQVKDGHYIIRVRAGRPNDRYIICKRYDDHEEFEMVVFGDDGKPVNVQDSAEENE